MTAENLPNVKESKVFAGGFFRHKFAEERTGKRLNAALRCADKHRENQKIAQRAQPESHKANHDIGRNADKNH